MGSREKKTEAEARGEFCILPERSRVEIFAPYWPWYDTGPPIGLSVPAMHLLINRHFGISSTFRDIRTLAGCGYPGFFIAPLCAIGGAPVYELIRDKLPH